MINFRNIPSDEIEGFVKKLDKKLAFVSSEFGIELKSYGSILRIGLNAIQNETIENLIERLKINKELEKKLDNVGGYTTDYLNENNPKTVLFDLLFFIKENQPKQKILIDFLNKTGKRSIAIADTNDLDFINQQIHNRKVEIIPYTACLIHKPTIYFQITPFSPFEFWI
ncbi:MAG: hypothetical protein M0Q41_12690 [Bacteroidales bacterium]|nr:hypothetical protein [Bacteroidales bacterium]